MLNEMSPLRSNGINSSFYQELIFVFVPQKKVAFASQGACKGVLAQLARHNAENKMSAFNTC
jgi:hypothetical protein